MGLIQEFKKFALRGNVVDMAVGVVIGAAFGKITTSLVNDVIMPIVGVITGGIDFSDWRIPITEGQAATETAEAVEPVTINIGLLINSGINFLIIAAAIFLVIKAMNSVQEAAFGEGEEEKAVEPPKDIQLLTEIRDALKNG